MATRSVRLMQASTKSFLAVALLGFAAGCSNGDVEEEIVQSTEQAKVIGTNDFVVVKEDGANIPAKYRPLLDAVGHMSMGCTATHIGNGIVLSAGHCFHATSVRKDNFACPNVSVRWGLRADSPSYLTSTCTTVLAARQSRDTDYSIFKVSPVPPVAIAVDYAARPAIDTTLTIFSHPRSRPLEWSQTCLLKPASSGGWGADQFSHQCDTDPGSSGATILNDASLAVIGIHDGGTYSWNYGTFLSDTPLAEILAAAPATATATEDELEPATP